MGYSADGIRSACEEQGFRQLLWIHAVLLIGIVVLDFTLPVRMILLLASLLSIVVELISTGLEAAVDHTSEEMHVLAKKAKDVGSAEPNITEIFLVSFVSATAAKPPTYSWRTPIY